VRRRPAAEKASIYKNRTKGTRCLKEIRRENVRSSFSPRREFSIYDEKFPIPTRTPHPFEPKKTKKNHGPICIAHP